MNSQSRANFNLVNIFSLFTICLFAFIMLSHGVAYAQTFDTAAFEPAKNDFSLAILSQMFGDLMERAGAGEYKGNLFMGEALDPFKTVLTSFTTLCAIVGVILGVNSLGQKITDAAEKSQAGDLATSLFWVRMGIGGTFIVPIHSGYCVVHVFVMYLIIQSVGAADYIVNQWLGVQYNGTSNQGVGSSKDNIDAMYQIKMPSPEIAQLVYKTAEGYSCVYGLASQKVADEFEQTYKQVKHNATRAQADIKAHYTEARQNPFNTSKKLNDYSGDGLGEIPTSKTSTDVANETKNEQQAENQKMNQARKQQINSWLAAESNAYAAAQNVARNGLDDAVQKIFGRDVATVQALHDRPFYFGIATLDESLANSKDHNKGTMNRETSAVCGAIDFTKTVNSTASKQIFQNAEKALQSMKEAKQITPEKFETSKNALANADPNALALKNKPKYDPEMIKAYLVVYNAARLSIARVAKEYVTTVNNQVRFVIDPETGQWQNAPLSMNELKQKRIEALDKFNEELRQISYSMEKELQSAMAAHFTKTANQGLISHYWEKGFDSLPAIMKDSNLNTNFVDSRNLANVMAARDGWMALGSTFMLLTNSISQAQSLGNFAPAMEFASNNKYDFSAIVGDGKEGVRNTVYKNYAYDDVIAYYGLHDQIAIRSTHPAIIRSLNPPTNTTNSLAALGMNLDLTTLSASNRHPLIVMIESGYSLLGAAERFLTHNAYWDARANRPVQKGGATNLAEPMNPATQSSMLLTSAMATMVMLGFMLAFFLPAQPFLIWVGATLGWFVAVIEALFIAPLWAAMHLSHDGSKLVGKAQTGYALLVALLFRAPMMVLGFIASFTLLQVYGIYLNYVFGFSVMLSLGGSYNTEEMTFISIASVLAAYLIYAMYMQIVITKIFNVGTYIADQSLRWIGAPTGNLSEYGNMAGAELSGKVQSFGQPLSQAGLQRKVENARMAGQSDNKEIANVLRQQDGLSAQELEFRQQTMTGSGYDRLFNSGSAGQNSINGFEAKVPAPKSEKELAEHADMHKDAMKVARDSDMTMEESQKFAKGIADMGYRDRQFAGAFKTWADNGVFSRGNDLAANREQLMSMLDKPNINAANQDTSNYIVGNGLSTSQAVQRAYSGNFDSYTSRASGLQQPSVNAQTAQQNGQVAQAQTNPQSAESMYGSNDTNAPLTAPSSDVTNAQSVAPSATTAQPQTNTEVMNNSGNTANNVNVSANPVVSGSPSVTAPSSSVTQTTMSANAPVAESVSAPAVNTTIESTPTSIGSESYSTTSAFDSSVSIAPTQTATTASSVSPSVVQSAPAAQTVTNTVSVASPSVVQSAPASSVATNTTPVASQTVVQSAPVSSVATANVRQVASQTVVQNQAPQASVSAPVTVEAPQVSVSAAPVQSSVQQAPTVVTEAPSVNNDKA